MNPDLGQIQKSLEDGHLLHASLNPHKTARSWVGRTLIHLKKLIGGAREYTITYLAQALTKHIEDNLEDLNVDQAKAILSHLQQRISRSKNPAICKSMESVLERLRNHADFEDQLMGSDDSMSARTSSSAEILSPLSPELHKKISHHITEGGLAEVLWLVHEGEVSLNDLKPLVDADVYAWVKLNIEFQSNPKTPLDMMALSRFDKHIGLGWGYKSANLTRLQAFSQEVSLRCSTCVVAVPEFLPIGDFEMQRYVCAQYPQLMDDWKRFLGSFPSTGGKIDPATATLSPDGAKILNEIRSKIAECFTQRPYNTPQLQAWLAKNNPEFVIIRSTGKEDSDTNSNAGGNASIPFVKATSSAISAAMAEVLASYFSEKSILQRMAAKDETLFQEELFLPVLIQNMVGERVHGAPSLPEEVPRSGVMFTRSTGTAEGLTEICVGLGNNEGIVSSSVTTDRCLIDSHGGVAKAVLSKNTRFVAHEETDGHYSCEPIRNDDALLRQSPALPDGVARDMKQLADFFSCEVYGSTSEPKALDIEFSMMACPGMAKPTIYLLQARPLIPVTNLQPPSYIEQAALESIPEEHKAHGKTLLDGGAYVRSNATSQVLVQETISQALTYYLNSPPDVQASIKSVVIRKPAPSTSHEAVILRSHGIAILIVEEPAAFSRIQNWITSKKPVSIDLQQGIVVQNESLSTHDGYLCYPMPLEYSITPSAMIVKLANLTKTHDEALAASTLADVKAFDDGLQKQIATLQKGRELLKVTGSETSAWRYLLTQMGSGDPDQATLAAATLLNRIQKIAHSSQISALPITRLELLMVLQEMSQIVERQFLPTLSNASQSLERLYPVRLLEACLFQSGEVMGGFSIKRTFDAIHREGKILSSLHVSLDEVVKAEMALSRAPFVQASFTLLSPESRELFTAVIKHLDTVADHVKTQKVANFIQTISSLNILTEWSNTELLSSLQKANITSLDTMTPENMTAWINGLVEQVDASHDELERCQRSLETVTLLRSQVSLWSNPLHIQKQANALMTTLRGMGFTEDSSQPTSLLSRYTPANRLSRLAILQTSLQVIRTYDEIIKAVKFSGDGSNPRTTIQHFKGFLDQYRTMMSSVFHMAHAEHLLTEAPGNLNQYSQSALQMQSYLRRIDSGGYLESFHDEPLFIPGFANIDVSCLDETDLKLQTLPSTHFNVASAIVGGCQDYEYSTTWPVTLEDYFTLFHQNMESTLGMLRLRQGIPLDNLPPAMKNYWDVLSAAMPYLSINVIQVVDGKVEMIINMPLRQHAGSIKVSYDPVKGHPITTSVDMYGVDEAQRWEFIAGAVSALGDDIPGLRIEPPKIEYKDPVGVSLEFADESLSENKLAVLANFINELGYYSCSCRMSNDYIRLTEQARVNLGAPKTIPLTRQDMARGAFFIAPTAISYLIQGGELDQAQALLDRIKMVSEIAPWVSDMHVDTLINGSSSNEPWSLACESLQNEITTAKIAAHAPGGPIISWGEFLGNLDDITPDALKHASPEQRKNAPFVMAAVITSENNLAFADSSLLDNEDFALACIQHDSRLYKYFSHRIRTCEHVVLEMAAHDRDFLSYSFTPPEVIANREWVLKALAYNGAQLQYVPSLIEDPQAVSIAVSSNGFALEFAHPSLKQDSTLAHLAVRNSGVAIRYVDPLLLQEDPSLYEDAVTSTPSIYLSLPHAIRMNPAVALKAAAGNIKSLHTFDPKFLNDPDWIIQLFSSTPSELIKKHLVTLYKSRLLAPDILANKDVAKIALALDYNIYPHLPAPLLQDPELLFIACATDHKPLAFAHPTIRNDPACGKLIIEQAALRFLRSKQSASLQRHDRPYDDLFTKFYDLNNDHDELARLSVSVDGTSISLFSNRLQNMPGIVAIAVAQDPAVLDSMNPDFFDNEEIAIASASRHPTTLARFSERIRANKEIITKIVKSCPLALQYASPALQRDPQVLAAAWGSAG